MPIVCIFMGYLLVMFCHLSLCQKEWQKSPLSLVPGGAARRSPNRATGGVAGHETTSFPGGESPSGGGGGPSHYDSRLLQILKKLGEGRQLDVRELVVMTESIDPAHLTEDQ